MVGFLSRGTFGYRLAKMKRVCRKPGGEQSRLLKKHDHEKNRIGTDLLFGSL